ncbi:MAG: hypothetical protein JWN40_4911 [Phycisphaerales bacterium]|nr:hypothetical protein [Phycisphaerales bacterium]
MIRRDAQSHFLLTTQHDHALLAGELARRLGNSEFKPPDPHLATLEAIAHHDCGWPLHDDHPTLNPAGLPLHVFEAPVPLATQVWSASVAGAMNLGDYQGLLVSLHTFALSSMFLANAKSPSRPDLFEMNKFQHRQSEIQEDLRKRIGLRTDVPLQLGLPKTGASPADDQLIFNFRLLTAMDRISLALCCGKHLFPTLDDVRGQPGQPPTRITAQMPDPSTMTLDPWPFDEPAMTFQVPAKRIPKETFATLDEFQRIYRETPAQPLTLHVRCATAQ